MSLVDLSPDLMDRILQLDGMTHKSLALWQCGSRALQQKLSISVTRVELVNKKEVVLLRLPTFLKALNALRHLVVDRDGYVLFDGQRTYEVLKALSARVEKLVLKFRHSGGFFQPHPKIIACDDWGVPNPNMTEEFYGGYIDAAASFPSLKTLKLDAVAHFEAEAIQLLPRSLQSLSLALPEASELNVKAAHALPTSLRRLESLGAQLSTSAPFFAALPRDLSHLAIRSSSPINTIEDIQALPPRLSVLTLQHYDPLTVEAMSAFPRTLTAAPITRIDPKSHAQVLSVLPPALTSLSLAEFLEPAISAQTLRSLPSSLTSLKSQINFDGVQQSDFPQSLTQLETIVDGPLFDANLIRLLPPYLRHFSLNKFRSPIDLGSLSHLPQYLLSLSAVAGPLPALGLSTLSFPPSLTDLDLKCSLNVSYSDSIRFGKTDYTEADLASPVDADNNPAKAGFRALVTFPFSALPRHLTTLRLEGAIIPMSALEFLPLQLGHLELHQFLQDAPFNLDDPQWQSRLKIIANTEPNHAAACELLSSPPHFFSLLPRSLHFIKARHPTLHEFEPEQWRLLPQHLQEIDLMGPQGATVPGQILQFLPMTHLRRLICCIGNVDDDLLQYISHGQLEYFDPDGDVEWEVTDQSADLCPLSLYVLGDGIAEDLFMTLQSRKEARLAVLRGPATDDATERFRSPPIQDD